MNPLRSVSQDIIPAESAISSALELAQSRSRTPGIYRSHARYFARRWGGIPIGELDSREIRRWKLERMSEASAATVRHQIAFLSVLFKHALEEGWIDRNPMAGIKRPPVNNARTRWLSPQEEGRLKAAMREEDFPAVRFAILTGMRRSEQWGMTWESVEWRSSQVLIPMAKHGRPRRVILNPEARELLERIRAEAENPELAGFVFSPGADNRRRAAGNFVERRFNTAVTEAELANLVWHDLRHTFASRLVMAGVHLRIVQELMGHQSITTTERYAHLSADHLHGAVAGLT